MAVTPKTKDTLLAKLCFQNKTRLAEVETCSMCAIRAKLGDYFGPAAAAGQLSYTLSEKDDEPLLLVTDGDCELAKRAGASPLKIVAHGGDPVAEPVDASPVEEHKGEEPSPGEDEREPVVVDAEPEGALFAEASRRLGALGYDATPAQIKTLLDVLEFRPERLADGLDRSLVVFKQRYATPVLSPEQLSGDPLP